MRDKKQAAGQSLLFAGVLVLLFAVFLIRQFYGFNKNDEIFYISTVYRFFQGDAMLVDEWNCAQLFTFITYPLYCLIRLFHDSNEGIVLIFRISYLVFQAGVSAYCFCRLRRFGAARILPALFYFVTTPYNINSLSYNTLAFGFVLLTLVTIAGSGQLRIWESILCGVFTAGAVLANPYAVLLFILYGAVCALVSYCGYRKKKAVDPALSIRHWFFMGVGAFLIFLLFAGFVFSRGSLREILESLSYIVMDAERQKSFWEKLAKYFIRIHRYYPALVWETVALLLLRLFDRGKRIGSSVYLALSVCTAVPYIVYYGFFWEMVGINYMLIPFAFPGLIAWLVTENKDNRLFFGWYVPGLFYTLLAHFATNTGILTVSASYMIASAASLLLILMAVSEQRKRWLTVLVCVLLTVQFTACVYQRITYVWGDGKLPELTCRLSEGPLEGIRTSEENETLYTEVLADMEELALTESDRLFVVGIAPWIYLNTEAECAAYSTWETLETDPLIFTYYELRPEKLPTVIYCYGYDEGILETEFADYFINMGYTSSAMRQGLVLEKR